MGAQKVTVGVKIVQHFKAECFDRLGNRKWVDEFDNLVVDAGRNKYLDATLKTGLAAPAWYVGLKGTGTPAAADTMASHATWSEIVPYSNANRVTWTPGTISDGNLSNSGNVAAFNINANTTVFGAFMVDVVTKSGTTGNLLGVGDFAANRAVESGDTLNVTVTASVAAS
jgi:hypothetical protein